MGCAHLRVRAGREPLREKLPAREPEEIQGWGKGFFTSAAG